MPTHKQIRHLHSAVLLTILVGGLLGEMPKVHATVDNGWARSILISTEGFHRIDGTDTSANYELKFGNTGSGISLNISTEFFEVDSSIEVFGTASGRIVHGQDTLSSSGTLAIERDARFNSGVTIQTTTDAITAFQVLDSDGGNPIFSIDTSNSRVGLGTVTPSDMLQLEAAGQPKLSIVDTTNSMTGFMQAGNTSMNLGTSSNHDLYFYTNNTLYATIENDGDVGIGTTGPETKLEVIGTMSGATVYSASGLIVESGRVGIGTSSPTAKLEIVGTMSGKSLIINTNQTNETGAIFLDQDGNGTGMLIDSEATNAPGLAIDMAGTTAQVPNAPHLLFGYNGAFDTNLYRSDANQLRTDDSFGIGRSPATYALEVQGDAGKTSGGTSWQSISDQRFKEVQSSVENAVETINQLNPVEYYWNDLKREKYGDIDRGLKFGFLAQELQHVLPELVNQDKEGYFWYNPSGFEAILSAAIQELDAKVSSLEERMISAEGAGSGASLYVADGFSGSGLEDCDTGATSKLLWDATTERFSCGTDQTGVGSSPTLQDAYDNDIDGSDAIIALTSADDSIIIRDPASGGSDSKFALTIDQLKTGYGSGVLINSDASSGAVLALDNAVKGNDAYGAPHILFGYKGLFDTNLFRVAADRLYTDDSFWVGDTLSGTIVQATTSLSSSGTLTWEGAGSGGVLEVGNFNNSITAVTGSLLVSGSGGHPTWKEPTSAMIWYIDGTVATGAGQGAKVVMPFGFTVTDVDMRVDTAPTGSSLIVDINDGGTTIFSARPEIDASGTSEDGNHVISDSTLAVGADITFDIDQVGSSTAGADLTVILKGRRHY